MLIVGRGWLLVVCVAAAVGGFCVIILDCFVAPLLLLYCVLNLGIVVFWFVGYSGLRC